MARKYKQIKDIDLELLKKLYLQGLTLRQLSKKFDCSVQSVSRWLKSLDIDIRKKGRVVCFKHNKKQCPKCLKFKSFDNYIKPNTGNIVGNGTCKQCARKTALINIRRKRQYLNEIKLNSGSIICGYNSNPVALDFDHLPGTNKKFNISEVLTCSMKRIKMEITKCQNTLCQLSQNCYP